MSPASAQVPATSPIPPRVLIVDDAQDDREMYALFLSTVGGCTVTEAGNGRDAIRAIEQPQPAPDVIVLDVMLPDVSGAEICRRVRSIPELAQTNVVTVTALPMQSPEVDRMISAGADAVLIKPCEPETLLAEIRLLMRHSRQLRQRGQDQRERAAGLRLQSERLLDRVDDNHRTARDLLRRAEHLTLTQRAKATFADLPGLRLTVPQAMRLWGFDEQVCKRVLDTLRAEGFLTRAEDGQYHHRAV